MEVSGTNIRGQRQWKLTELLPTHTADLSPNLKFLGPGSSMLGSSDMIAAEMDEVVDLIVGRSPTIIQRQVRCDLTSSHRAPRHYAVQPLRVIYACGYKQRVV